MRFIVKAPGQYTLNTSDFMDAYNRLADLVHDYHDSRGVESPALFTEEDDETLENLFYEAGEDDEPGTWVLLGSLTFIAR